MTTEERLQNLERELSRAKGHNRWLLVGMGLVLGIAAFVWEFGLAPTKARAAGGALKELHANSFILEDKTGKMGADLSMTEDGPVLRLYGENSKARATLFVHGKAGIALSDEDGKIRAYLGVTQNMPSLFLYDENGEARFSLAVLKGVPHLSLLDEKGKPLPIR